MVRITHPYHPHYGEQVEVISVRRYANPAVEPDLIVRLDDGPHLAIGASWTDWGGQDTESLVQPPVLLDLEGLRELARFVAHHQPATEHAQTQSKIKNTR